MENDKKIGDGKFTFGAYGVFEGELDENENFSGLGKFDFPSQKMRYEGTFRNGKFDGEGIIYHVDTGNVYEGEF
jgi:hypothetical protein